MIGDGGPDRPRDAAHGFVADLRDFGADDLDGAVAQSERSRLREMSPRRRAQFAAGRALLRFAAGPSTGHTALAAEVTQRAGGKLECANGKAVSVSHSGNLVACAVASAGDVGIDVQRSAEHYHTEEIARAWFTREECEWLRRGTRDAFFQLWVLKEAYLKCLGSGLSGGLAAIACRIDAPTIEVRAAAAVRLALYAAGDAFVGIAATAADVAALRIEAWSPRPTRSSAPPLRLIASSSSA